MLKTRYLMAVIIVILLLIIEQLSARLQSYENNPCASPLSQACMQFRFDECMATHKFSRSECLYALQGRG